MAGKVAVLTVPPQEPSAFPGTHIWWLTTTYNSPPGDPLPFSWPLLDSAFMCLTLTQTYTHTHKGKAKKKSLWKKRTC